MAKEDNKIKLKKQEILKAASIAVDELIKVLKSKIVGLDDLSDITADKMKNAAAAKRLAFEDALSMMERIEKEESLLNSVEIKSIDLGNRGFAENYATGKK